MIRGLVGLGARLALLFVVLQALFLGSLVAAAALPDEPIVDHLAADVRQGSFGRDGAPDGVGGRGTSFTDCVAVGSGLGGPSRSAFEEAVRAPRLDSCRKGAQQVLDLQAGESVASDEYFRYWAGYTPLTRVVLSVARMDGLRMAATAMFGLSLLVLTLVVAGRTTPGYAVALLGPLLVSSNALTVSQSFTHALSLAVAFLGVSAVAWAAARGAPALAAWTVVAAATFNFVDLLTVPAVPWAFSAAVAGAVVYRRTDAVMPALRAIVLVGCLWPVVFAATWATRWLVGAAVIGWTTVMDNVTAKVDERIADHTRVSGDLGAGVVLNVRTWLDTVVTAGPTLLACAVVVLVSAVVVVRGPRARRDGLAAVVLAVPALVVVFWLTVLSNHSQVHDHFVYRTVPAALGVVTAAAVLAAARPRALRVSPTGEAPREAPVPAEWN